eukprot:3493265-Rhodomonas_salina.1
MSRRRLHCRPTSARSSRLSSAPAPPSLPSARASAACPHAAPARCVTPTSAPQVLMMCET